MDCSEATRLVFNRIEKLEPDNVSKIIGYLLLQDNANQEMIRLAFGPDNLIVSFINKAKIELGKSKLPSPISPTVKTESNSSNLHLQLSPPSFSPSSSRFSSSCPSFHVPNSLWDQQVSPDHHRLIRNMDIYPQAYSESISEDYHLHNQVHFLSFDDHQLDPIGSIGPEFASRYYHSESALSNMSARASRRSPSLPEFPVKSCHYFNKGYCKHGNNCRYFHGQLPDSFSQIFNPNGSELLRDDHVFSPGSLEKLEMELTELLRSRRGLPVSIASLPMMYYERYGRTLQAEGYLTESQRHGKAGYSLTKLLARLKNSIRLIDRPHGQHSVVLAEDAPNYVEYRNEKNDPGGIVAGSRQIYLTFPAESTFTEEDVSNYFKSFGPVQDVRIPCQQKRMFGFVTFVYPETVRTILAKGSPHFVCGARVLVKPYREKSRPTVDREKSRPTVDRKYSEKYDAPNYYNSHIADMDNSELHSIPRISENSKLKKQYIEEHEQAELERRLSEFQLATKSLIPQPQHYYNLMDGFRFLEGNNHYSSTSGRFSYLLDVINNGSTSDDIVGSSSSNYNDTESSQGIINLPESPFATTITSDISTVT